MLSIQFVRENFDAVVRNTANKNTTLDISAFPTLDAERRELITKGQDLKALRNTVSEEIARLKKAKENADDKIAEMRSVGDTIKSIDDRLRAIEEELDNLLLLIPNMTHESVVVGKSAEENIEIRRKDGVIGNQPDKAWRKDHIELCKLHGLVDFERGAKIAGSGFPLYTGKGARLERALLNFFLDQNTGRGYDETMPPFVVNTTSMRGTGQLPKFAEDLYRCADDDLYLIPTSEVPLTNIHRDDILSAEELPKKITGYSACFRREAGSYGKDTRGFLRLHQFNKVELLKFVHPEDSYNELELMLNDVENLLTLLGLNYRIISLVTGDTGFSSAKTYDFEVWSPCEQKWLECSSCSNFEDFQARRANIRFKRDANAKPEFVHTLNGSGLATSRIMVALLESYQQEDGSIVIPDVLRSYTGFDQIG